MNKRRLLKLADLLEENANNKKGMKFDLGIVARSQADTPKTDCGTVGCAIGLAMVCGAFKRAGLSYTVRHRDGPNVYYTPVFGDITGFDDVPPAFFDITRDENYFLFVETAYKGATTGAIGERKVARRIRDLVAGTVSSSD